MLISLREKLKPLIPNHLFIIYRQLRAVLFYHGDNVECPVCDGRFSKMRDYKMVNLGFRANEICPQCGSKSRHRLYAYFFKHLNIIGGNLRILHVAPDAGIRHLLEPNNHYIGADLLAQNVDINLNIQQLPFADNFFDVIVCSHVLEHVDNDKQAMQEFVRILKPGAWALLQTPLGNSNPDETYEDITISEPKERLKHFGQEDHVRIYGANDFYNRLSRAGFEVELLGFADTLSEATKARYVLSDETLIIGHKE